MWYTNLYVNWHLNDIFMEEQIWQWKDLTTICYTFSVTVHHAIKYYEHCYHNRFCCEYWIHVMPNMSFIHMGYIEKINNISHTRKKAKKKKSAILLYITTRIFLCHNTDKLNLIAESAHDIWFVGPPINGVILFSYPKICRYVSWWRQVYANRTLFLIYFQCKYLLYFFLHNLCHWMSVMCQRFHKEKILFQNPVIRYISDSQHRIQKVVTSAQ